MPFGHSTTTFHSRPDVLAGQVNCFAEPGAQGPLPTCTLFAKNVTVAGLQGAVST